MFMVRCFSIMFIFVLPHRDAVRELQVVRAAAHARQAVVDDDVAPLAGHAEPRLRTNGVNTNGAAAKVMNLDRLGKKVRPGTFGNIKVG